MTSSEPISSWKNFIPLPSLVIAIVAVIAGVIVQHLPAELSRQLSAESGPFEWASVLFFGIACVMSLREAVRQRSIDWIAASTLLTWAVLRELDFQKRFTYRSIESTGYYLRPIASLPEKLLVLAILVPFAVAALWLMVRAVRRLPSGFRQREEWLGHLFILFGLGSTIAFFEKIVVLPAAEEVAEAGFSLLILRLVGLLRSNSTERQLRRAAMK